MVESKDGTRKRNALFYDFYASELWNERIEGLRQAIDAALDMFLDSLATIDGLKLDDIDRLRDVEQSEKYLENLVERLRALEILSNEHASDLSEQALDFDFEVKQLLNLYVQGRSLHDFVADQLVDLVKELLSQSADDKLPPIHLVRELFLRVTTDAEVIQRAIDQRRWQLHDDKRYRRSPQARSLLVADKLVFKALAPFRHLLPLDREIVPITFFTQETHIHNVPYRENVILVGLSHVHLSLGINRAKNETPLPAFELLVLPHEIGHYIYHHGELDRRRTFAWLSEQFRNNDYYAWCEEIFADTYSCLVAGPITALSLQALLAHQDASAICANDGIHPTPELRPFILSEILRVLSDLDKGYQAKTVANRLDDNWERILERQGFVVTKVQTTPSEITVTSPTPLNTVVDVDAVREAVRPIIQEFASHLVANINAEPWGKVGAGDLSPKIPWTDGSHHDDLTKYDEEMAALTSTEFAMQRVPHYSLKSISQTDAEGRLRHLLDKWDDSGPLSIGGHDRPINLDDEQVKQLYDALGNAKAIQKLPSGFIAPSGVTVEQINALFAKYPKWSDYYKATEGGTKTVSIL